MTTEQTTLANNELIKSKDAQQYFTNRAYASRDKSVQEFYYRKAGEQEMFTKGIETIIKIYETE